MGLLPQESGTIKKHYKGVCVKVYLNEKRFLEEIKRAEKSGKRRVGLLPFTQKSHGFEWEKVANTDGLAKYYKLASDSYMQTEAERLVKEAEAKKKKQEAEAELKKLGITD